MRHVTPHALIEIDSSGFVVSVRDGEPSLPDGTPAVTVGARITDFVSVPGTPDATVLKTLTGGGNLGECRYQAAAGGTRYGALKHAPEYERDGPRLVLRLTDNTDRALSNEVIRSAMAREQSLLNSIGDGVLVLDARGRIINTNEAATRLFGGGYEMLIGHSADDLLADSSGSSPISTFLTRTVNSGSYKLARAKGSRLDAGVFNCAVRISEVHPGTDSARWVLIVTATASRDSLDTRRQNSARMEAVSTFAGRLANDFNNALAAISGSIEAARIGESQAEIRIDLEAAADATASAARLVRCLMNLANPTQSQRKPTDPARIIEKAASSLRRKLDPRIEISMDLHHGDWQCKADDSQILDILINLGDNARDAMPAGGRLELTTHCVTRTGNPDDSVPGSGEFVRIDVVDQGMGIPPDDLPRIFEPMFTTRTPGTGAGLGLAFVYDVLKQHGGGITVESAINVGTSFHIFLPRYVPDRLAVDPAVDNGSHERQTILFIDDEDAVRRPCVRALERAGFSVVEAGNGFDGLAEFAERRDEISAVVLDIVMPGKNGWDVLSELKEDDPDLPVLMVSGYSGRTHNPAEQAHQPDGFLKKPFELAELVETVCTLARAPAVTA